jgi:hypothetical protein
MTAGLRGRAEVDRRQIPHRVSVPLVLVELRLLEDVVAAGLPLQLLKHQVVGRGELIVLVVLNEDYRLGVEVRVLGRDEGVPVRVLDVPLHHGQRLVDYRDRVLAHHDALDVRGLHLVEPVVRSDVFGRISSLRICVQYFLNQILAISRYKARYQIIAIEDFLVQLIGVRILEGQVPAGHGV